MRVVLHPEAPRELRRAALWYEEHSPGLGTEFLATVAAIGARRERPKSFPPWPDLITAGRGPIRRADLRKFPYVLAFETRTDQILVLAVAHGKRRPAYWSGRVEE